MQPPVDPVRVRELNDDFRRSLTGGRVLFTAGVDALSYKSELLESVRGYSRFTEGNDPYGEHDFGSIDMRGEQFFWKIDYYDRSLTYGSEDPSDPSKTMRVLTLMLASEY